jgi:hypothetical protein
MEDASQFGDSLRDVAQPRRRATECSIIVAAAVIAVVSAHDYAGGWNDGSRLATVESLVDRHTLVIDDSIFVRSPATAESPNPYTPGDELLRTQGTKDKLLIGGRFYSDKSPLPAFWLAGCYQVLQWSTGLIAHQYPRLFCYLMTVCSSGIAYVVAVWSTWRLAIGKGLPQAACLLLAASLALATTALPYVRHVNNHILLLAVTSLLMLVLDHIAGARVREGKRGRGGEVRHLPLFYVGAAGTLAGGGYSLDLGVGPVLLLCTTGLVVFRTRSFVDFGCFAFAALPWLAAHHTVNYLTGGTLGPANSVPEYLAWPGSPFSTANMTGGWAHGTIGHSLLYAAALLFGKHGFLNYNLPLCLAAVGFVVLIRRRIVEWPEVLFAAGLSGGSWLLYAALSNNYSGPCCSIRWFVPLLAPSLYVLVLLLRERPALARDLALFSVAGLVLNGVLFWSGPWDGRVPLALWPLNVAAWTGWGILHARQSKARSNLSRADLAPALRRMAGNSPPT